MCKGKDRKMRKSALYITNDKRMTWVLDEEATKTLI